MSDTERQYAVWAPELGYVAELRQPGTGEITPPFRFVDAEDINQATWKFLYDDAANLMVKTARFLLVMGLAKISSELDIVVRQRAVAYSDPVYSDNEGNPIEPPAIEAAETDDQADAETKEDEAP